jgi:hypothetical protein
MLVVGIAALAATLGVMQVRGAESEEPGSLGKVPAKVRATIQKHAEGAKVRKVEVATMKVYDVEIRKNGKTTEFSVSLDGKFLGVKTDDDDEKDEEKAEAKHAKKAEAKEEDDEQEEKDEAKHAKKGEAKEEDEEKDEGKQSGKAPAAVLATVKKLVGKGKVLELARESDGTYELDYQVKGVHQAAIIAVDGSIQETEITVKASELPKAALQAVKKLYPKGKITLAEKSTSKDGVVYELSVSIGITVTPDGKIKQGAEED